MKAEYYLNKNLYNSKLIENILNNINFRFINNSMNREESFLFKTFHRLIPKNYKDFFNTRIEDQDSKKIIKV